MVTNVLKRMSGEELLLMRILKGESIRSVIETELDRRAYLGPMRRHKAKAYSAGRSFAVRQSEALVAVAS